MTEEQKDFLYKWLNAQIAQQKTAAFAAESKGESAQSRFMLWARCAMLAQYRDAVALESAISPAPASE